MRNRTENKIKIVLIRHGTTASNELKRYLGKTDEVLCESGMAGIRQKKAEGKYPPAELIAASPMKRCRQTAELIYGIQPSVLVEEWREIDFGRFEGKNYLELRGDTDYQKWIDSGGKLAFPEGESQEEFIKRCNIGFSNFCSHLNDRNPKPQTAALVMHGGTIMSILSCFSGEEYFSYQCENGEGFSFELDMEKPFSIHRIKRL